MLFTDSYGKDLACSKKCKKHALDIIVDISFALRILLSRENISIPLRGLPLNSFDSETKLYLTNYERNIDDLGIIQTKI